MVAKTREKQIPESKIKNLKSLVDLIKKSKTVMIVSIKSIPGNKTDAVDMAETAASCFKNSRRFIINNSTFLYWIFKTGHKC